MVVKRMVGKTERKIRQSGDSKVVGLPPDWLRFYGLEVGDKVEMFALQGIVIVMPKHVKINSERIEEDIHFLLSKQSE